MIKILLFALVCASFGQVHGGNLEEEKKTAIRIVDSLNRIVSGHLSSTLNEAEEITFKLPQEVDAFNKKLTELKQKAVGNVQNTSKVFQKTAKDNKLPESVIKCITKEEAAAIKAIGDTATKYTNEVKKVAAEKSYLNALLLKDLKKLDSSLEVFFPTFEKDLSLNWFPFASLVNSSSQKPIDDSKLIRNVIDKADIDYGKRPDCDEEEKERICFRLGRVQQFNLVLYPNEDVKLYVSKKSSYNDEGRFKVETRGCGFSKYPSDQNNTKETEGGDLLPNSLFKPIGLRFFPLDKVCFDNGPDESFLVEFCPCKTVACVRKCCGDGELFDEREGKCVSDSLTRNWRPHLKGGSLTSDYYLLSKRYPSTCRKPILLKIPPTGKESSRPNCGNPQHRNKFLFLSDGSLKVKKYKDNIPAQSYCGDHVIYESSILLENNLLICLDEDTRFAKFLVYGVVFIFGGFVLLITVMISLYLPELRSSVFNKIIICHNVSLMLADFIWGWSYLLHNIEYTLCTVLSLSFQYTFLGSFSWMNVMSFHIFQGMRRLSSARGIKNTHQFVWYILYACGVPLLITSITAAMEFAPSLPYYIIRPGFGCYNCGFNPDTSSVAYYVYTPMATLIMFNVLFFIMTFLQIMKIQRETAILQRKDSSLSLNRGKKRFKIFSKLFLLAGLSWMMEIVGWAVGGKDYYWYIPDLFNILRSVFIFVIFVCKRKILWSLLGKLKKTSEERGEVVTKSTDGISEMELAEIKRRERILRKQITQTFRRSDESSL